MTDLRNRPPIAGSRVAPPFAVVAILLTGLAASRAGGGQDTLVVAAPEPGGALLGFLPLILLFGIPLAWILMRRWWNDRGRDAWEMRRIHRKWRKSGDGGYPARIRGLGLLRPDIAGLKERKNVDGLLKALLHKNPRVRSDAARALGEIGGAHAVGALCEALADPSDAVRGAVETALVVIGDGRAVPPLIVARAWDALSKLGALESVAPLFEEITNNEARQPVVAVLTATLEKRGEDSFRSALLQENPAVQSSLSREYFVKALEKDHDAPSTKLLLFFLGDPYYRVRVLAAESLANRGWKPDNPEQRAIVATTEGFWNRASDEGIAALEPLLVALFYHGHSDATASKVASSLARAGVPSKDNDREAIAATVNVLFDHGQGSRAIELLLQYVHHGVWHHICSQILADLYHNGRLDDRQKQSILADRKSIIGREHTDTKTSHTDKDLKEHYDYKFFNPHEWRNDHKDGMMLASDCSHMDTAHDDVWNDVNLL